MLVRPHDAPTRTTAKQHGTTFIGNRAHCATCSIAAAHKEPVNKITGNRLIPHCAGFMDFGSTKPVPSLGVNNDGVIFLDDFSSKKLVRFTRGKRMKEAADTSRGFIADVAKPEKLVVEANTMFARMKDGSSREFQQLGIENCIWHDLN